MSKKIMLINADQPEECRAVLLDDGKVEDLIVEHASHEQIKGNIYVGVINRIEPAIEAAFMDIGVKKFGFLPFKDVNKENYIQTGETKARTRIQDVLVRGQKLLVQVAKEGRDHKGPSLTNSLSLPGRFLVLVSGQEASAVSRKIEDEAERKKLRQIVDEFKLPENLGLIIRTAGLGRTKAELNRDLQMLLRMWDDIQKKIKDPEQEPPIKVYQEPGLVVRTVRDHFTTDTSEIIVDNNQSYRALKDFMKMLMPRLGNRIVLHKGTRPLFSLHKVEEQIEIIYNRTIPLPSGGSIVIDTGEAMVSIDVNSGKTTSASQLEETALKTNLEAADEVARQLRLRDLGGLVVIDFIDMFQRRNKTQVEKQLKQACKNDKARINLSRISKFGLIEMSRQRISPPVKTGVFESCPRCDGSGHVKSVGAMALQVLRSIQDSVGSHRVKVLSVQLSPEVVEYLLNEKMKYLMDFQESHGVQIKFSGKPGLPYENFVYTVEERKPAGDGSAEVEASSKEKDNLGRDSRGRSSRSSSRGSRRRGGRSSQRPHQPRAQETSSDIPQDADSSAEASSAADVKVESGTPVDASPQTEMKPDTASEAQPQVEGHVESTETDTQKDSGQKKQTRTVAASRTRSKRGARTKQATRTRKSSKTETPSSASPEAATAGDIIPDPEVKADKKSEDTAETKSPGRPKQTRKRYTRRKTTGRKTTATRGRRPAASKDSETADVDGKRKENVVEKTSQEENVVTTTPKLPSSGGDSTPTSYSEDSSV